MTMTFHITITSESTFPRDSHKNKISSHVSYRKEGSYLGKRRENKNSLVHHDDLNPAPQDIRTEAGRHVKT